MKKNASRALGAVALSGLIIFSGLIPLTAPRASAAAPRAHMPYKIVLSNSYIGNTWRVEMENEFKAACAMPPFKTEAKCSYFNSGNDVSKQTQQMDDII